MKKILDGTNEKQIINVRVLYMKDWAEYLNYWACKQLQPIWMSVQVLLLSVY